MRRVGPAARGPLEDGRAMGASSDLRRGLGALALAATLGLSACDERPSLAGRPPGEITFSAPVEADAVQGLLDDMAGRMETPVRRYEGRGAEARVAALKSGEVKAGWFAPRVALETKGETDVLAKVVGPAGEGRRVAWVARKGAGLTPEALAACGRRHTVGGYAEELEVISAFVLAAKGTDAGACFKARGGRGGLAAVAAGRLDAAASEVDRLRAFAAERPADARKLEVIWTSPSWPPGVILARRDLDPAVREKLRQFLLTYGRSETQRLTLAGLGIGGFRPLEASDLDPVRELAAAAELAKARESGDAARLARARAAFEKARAASDQRRAAEPDS